MCLALEEALLELSSHSCPKNCLRVGRRAKSTIFAATLKTRAGQHRRLKYPTQVNMLFSKTCESTPTSLDKHHIQSMHIMNHSALGGSEGKSTVACAFRSDLLRELHHGTEHTAHRKSVVSCCSHDPSHECVSIDPSKGDPPLRSSWAKTEADLLGSGPPILLIPKELRRRPLGRRRVDWRAQGGIRVWDEDDCPGGGGGMTAAWPPPRVAIPTLSRWTVFGA